MLLSAMDETGAAPAADGDDRRHRVRHGARPRRQVRAIGVSWGYHDAAELLKAGAGTLIHDYPELDAAIERVLE